MLHEPFIPGNILARVSEATMLLKISLEYITNAQNTYRRVDGFKWPINMPRDLFDLTVIWTYDTFENNLTILTLMLLVANLANTK